jgi:hypothetical protein
MQSSEHEAQTGFTLHPAFILLRYGYGDLTFRKRFLYWGAPSALGIAGDG